MRSSNPLEHSPLLESLIRVGYFGRRSDTNGVAGHQPRPVAATTCCNAVPRLENALTAGQRAKRNVEKFRSDRSFPIWISSTLASRVLWYGQKYGQHLQQASKKPNKFQQKGNVSNHGGRNLDTTPASIDALPRIADAIEGRVPILFDSGIRRGTDIIKALALGAQAVLVGRPYIYGLSVSGASGVERVITILRTELETAMALIGKVSISELDSSVFWSASTRHADTYTVPRRS